MATLAFTLVGNYLGGPVGGAVGGAIGAYIDQQYLFPALFPQDDVAGPRLDALHLGGASEGTPMNSPHGPTIKVGATVIWTSDPRVLFDTQTTGGSGGGGEPITTSTVRADFAFHYAETSHLSGGKISAVKKVFFDTYLVWEDREDVNIQDMSADVSVVAVSEVVNQTTFNFLEYRSPPGGVDLSVIRVGVPLTVTGFTNSQNNITNKRVARSGTDSNGTFCSAPATGVVEAASGSTKTFTQVNPKFDASFAEAFTFYDGSQTTPDATMVAEEGAGNVPAYVQSAFCVIKGADLTFFGNRLPTSIEVLVEADATLTRQQFVERLGVMADRPASEFDASLVTGDLNGYVSRGLVDPGQTLQQAMLAFDIKAQDSGGVLRFFDRGAADVVQTDPADLAAHELGSDDTALWDAAFDDHQFRTLPRSIRIAYIDSENEYQFGGQVYRRVSAATGVDLQYRFDLVLSAAEAQCIIRRILWQRVANAIQQRVSLPPSYIRTVENDRLLFTPDDGDLRQMYVDQVDVGDNGLRIYRGVDDYDAVNEFSVADCIVDLPDVPVQEVYVPAPLGLTIADLPPLTSAHADLTGLYWASANYERTSIYGGATLYEALDLVNFLPVQATHRQATLGRADTALGDPIDINLIDEKNFVDVFLYSGGVASVTTSELLRGFNRGLLGDEIIGWRTATAQGDNVFRLSGLLRGLADTGDEVTTHVDNERFMVLDDGGVDFYELSELAYGTTRAFKSVAAGGDEADFDAQAPSFAINLNTLRPFAPYVVKGTRDGSNNLTITWERRTQRPYNSLSGAPLPPKEDTTFWEVQITSGSGRVIGPLTDTTATYLASEQTNDGITPGDPVSMNVFETSARVGRSKPEFVTV